ncbi:MAG: hypothetical protein IOD12_13520, partial [Silvanigrellales bacterium]|nr:hypothetical protein [Silvanigrellales bacterium]
MANAKSLLERILLEERLEDALAFEHVFEHDSDHTSARTWGDLRDAMWRHAAAFDALFPKAAPVVLVCSHGPEFAPLMIAGFLSGRPVVPTAVSSELSPQENVTRLLSVIVASKAETVVCSGLCLNLAPILTGALQKTGLSDRIEVHVFQEIDEHLPKGSGRPRPLPHDVNAPALVQFSLGGTHASQRAVLTLEGLRAQSAFIEKNFQHNA